ncbi:aminotransferase class V-fold PLP-dependent enzyme [Candidatus Woesearchaeota archaeon]|nr:aminotransferase class V-fold PLP-dependent enzyme [Candidatus Woesearchaeota archaeon]
MNIEKIRQDFPVLGDKIKGRPVIYFDSACMALKPRQVIEAMNDYYLHYPGCGERSEHAFGKKVTEMVEQSRKTMAKFIGAKNPGEIIFTRNATEGINIVANGFDFGKSKSNVALLSEKEHNSTLLPWQKRKMKGNARMEFAEFGREGFNLDDFSRKVKNAGIVSVVYTSNMDGSSVPAGEVVKIAHENKVPVLLDAAQAIPHKEIDVRKLDVDFLAFSGHKMLGPTGTGVLYGKKDMLEKLDGLSVGGGTVMDSNYDSAKWENAPERFEAGLQNYAGIIGMAKAAEYLKTIGMDEIEKHEIMLNKKASDAVSGIGAEILGPEKAGQRGGILSFNLPGMDPHAITIMLNESRNIMIRAGRHCVHSWFNHYKVDGSARASFYMYNTEEEVDAFIDEMKKISGMMR